MSDTPHILPRGLSRKDAAAYCGVSASTFDGLVRDGLMPCPKRLRSRVIWDRLALDRAFDALPGEGQDDGDPNEWDSVL